MAEERSLEILSVVCGKKEAVGEPPAKASFGTFLRILLYAVDPERIFAKKPCVKGPAQGQQHPSFRKVYYKQKSKQTDTHIKERKKKMDEISIYI